MHYWLTGSNATLALNADGGTGERRGDCSNSRECSQVSTCGVTQVYSLVSAFLALNTEAANCCYGYNYKYGTCPNGIMHYLLIAINAPALNADAGTGQRRGDYRHSRECSQVSRCGVTQVYSTVSAFLAPNNDAGNGQCGGYYVYAGGVRPLLHCGFYLP